jgi:hypothetical protein
MLAIPPAIPCDRCRAVRAQVQVARVRQPAIASWRCPDCGMMCVPVREVSATADTSHVPPPKPCPCPLHGPLQLAQDARTPAANEWWWVCAGCGAGHYVWH